MNSGVSNAAMPLKLRHFVEGSVDGAFRGRSVVADNEVDQRVVEDLELLNGVDEPADVVVGVLQEPGVHLHLSFQDGSQFFGHVIPSRDLGVAFGEVGIGADDPEFLLAFEGDLALTIPAVCELTLVLVSPLLWARGAERGWRRARST